MFIRRSFALLVSLLALCLILHAQEFVIVHSPVEDDTPKPELTAAERNLMNRVALPKVRKKLAGLDFCEESFEPSAVLHGAFSRPGAEQTVIFYQYCQTGNGLGEVGVVLIEGNKIIGNYIADAGWTLGGKVLPDINQNGLNEFALYYSGGIHQGSGGTGIEIMEFGLGGLRGIGWLQAESFDDKGNDFSYKVTVKPGKLPSFYCEKYIAASTGKFRRVGRAVPFRPSRNISKFEVIR